MAGDATGEGWRIAELRLDERTVIRRSAEIEHERAVAIYDLIEANYFRPLAAESGPFEVVLSIEDNRLIMAIAHADGAGELPEDTRRIVVPMSPFRRIIRDYFLICESYYAAIKTSTLAQIEAIDMGRRGLHNEGAGLLRETLADRIDFDEDTARRLFTLICVLHIRG